MKIKYLVMSDIHLGHRVNESKNIETNMGLFFNRNKALLNDIDVLFIAGDSFDRLLSTCTTEYIDSINCLIKLYNWCKDKNVKFRILEGTPSHDWRQCRVLDKIIKELGGGVDFKYIDDLFIENINGYNVLYIPDEYKDKSSETVKDINKLLKNNSLEEVDICIMHGAFNYQLPIHLESSFNEDDIESIVKHYIHVGHIHTFSNRGKIIAQGSFDRLRFGEEEAKGCVLANIEDNEKEYIFLENKEAMIFKTIDLTNVEDDKLMEEMDKEINKVKRCSSVRIIVKDKDKLMKNNKRINSLYKDWNLKIEVAGDKKLSIADKIVEDNIIEAFSITSENIVQLVESELDKLELSNQDKDRILDILKSIK